MGALLMCERSGSCAGIESASAAHGVSRSVREIQTLFMAFPPFLYTIVQPTMPAVNDVVEYASMTDAASKKDRTLSRGARIIFSYLREFRGIVILLSTLAIIQAIADGTAPFLVGRLFDAILETDSYVTLFEYTVASWAVFFVALVSVWITGGALGWFIDRRRRALATDLVAIYPARAFARLLRLPVSFHKAEKSGEVLERVQRARHSLDVIVTEIAIGIGPEMLSVAIGLGFALYINPLLGAILIGGILVYVATLINLVTPLTGMLRESNKAWRAGWGVAHDAFGNYQAVKQATAEEYEEKKVWDKLVSVAAEKGKRIGYIWSGISFYQRIIVVITQTLLIGISIYFIRQGTLTIGELLALNGYAGMLFGPFARLGYQWQSVQSGLVNIIAAEEMYALQPEKAYGDGRQLKSIHGEVAFRNVSFAYPDDTETTVLNDVTFTIKPGEVVALVGESGVGKSTTIELLSGYYYPSNGSVEIDGNDTRELDLASLRQHIAVVPQEPVLFNDTVLTNIKYGTFRASKKEVEAAAQEARADAFIEKFPKKYDTLVGERGVKLSVGQKQRIAIARAILRDPKILILDEPTSALDARTEQYITESLEKLMEGRTTFVIAHRLSTVRKADTILVFESGTIVEVGTHDELIKKENGIYRNLYEYQIGLH
ncbi:hypothetical protein COU17_02315 [Candidatus Kaiserbacteria bacterium CG10_big_fil_rev_8_21_14_0_10_49_17]|uniref:ABC transporter ATP-binding protein n=1 Tax=Candidatus Kaiserbacteria bacterium CG10_big_fil_rev_8_21_14_0_10_49_17 TaxID=1974609 RepID=A0A2M6WE73_9BACT|nr:MAG: hypothetical protein COU17_02315 [Candidatus Kaiserbacteria bacterium CG10_big_fil_rev_8_21_14_0_10_49_17]